jgi:hypothetical protein
VDLRAQHGPVDVTPALAVDELMRSQVSAAVEAPVGSVFLVRGSGRLAAMSRPGERNVGSRYGGGLAALLAPSVHLSGGWQQSRYRRPAVGYFAPRRTDTIEAGLDMDIERGAFALALDAGAGVDRVRKFGDEAVMPAPRGAAPSPGRGNAARPQQQTASAPGRWEPSLRAWGLASWALRPGRLLAIEFEAYDSRVADAVLVAEQWRYASVTASLRLAVRR